MKNKFQSHIDNRETTPFISSEEAWFWYCLCEQLGFERAKGGESKIARPCESSDIAIAIKRLFRQGILHPEHIRVLSTYGFKQVPPHEHFGDTPRICKLWQEGLKFLGILLQQKGIVYSAS